MTTQVMHMLSEHDDHKRKKIDDIIDNRREQVECIINVLNRIENFSDKEIDELVDSVLKIIDTFVRDLEKLPPLKQTSAIQSHLKLLKKIDSSLVEKTIKKYFEQLKDYSNAVYYTVAEQLEMLDNIHLLGLEF